MSVFAFWGLSCNWCLLSESVGEMSHDLETVCAEKVCVLSPTFLRVAPHHPQLLRLLELCWTLLWDPGNKTGLDLGEARDGAWAGPTTLTSPQDARNVCAQTHNTHTQKLTSKLLSAIHKPLYSLRPLPSQIMYSNPGQEMPLHFLMFSLPQFCEAGAMIFTLFSSNEEISSEGLSDLSKVVQLLIGEARAQSQV